MPQSGVPGQLGLPPRNDAIDGHSNPIGEFDGGSEIRRSVATTSWSGDEADRAGDVIAHLDGHNQHGIDIRRPAAQSGNGMHSCPDVG